MRAVDDQKMKAFLDELVEVSRRHGFSLGHEDQQGAFTVEHFTTYNRDWLLDALNNIPADAPPFASAEEPADDDFNYPW
jgi:hypothetical protein